MLKLLALSYLFEGMQIYLQGPIRALGLQKIASYYTIAAFYIFGIPIACVLSVKLNFGIYGLQIGFGSAVLVQCLSYAIILLKTDWQSISNAATKRI